MRARALPHAHRAPSTARTAIAVLALAIVSCAPAPQPPRRAGGQEGWVNEGGPTPVSTTGAEAPKPAASAAPKPRERWDALASLASLRRALPRAPSQHFAGAHDGEVLANEAAAAYPSLGPSRALGPGAMLVEVHRARGRDDVVAYLVMTKRPPGSDPATGDWEFAVVSPAGEIEARGALPTCARCHADAPHDRTFGLPRH